MENPVNLNLKTLFVAGLAILAAACGIFALTSIDAGHTMRGLLLYILACSLLVCTPVVAGHLVQDQRLTAWKAQMDAYVASVLERSSNFTYAFADAGSPEPKEDPRARKRAELEHVLVHGASHNLAADPSRAVELANGVKAFMATLEGAASTALPVIDPGPDALEREIQAKGEGRWEQGKAPRVTQEMVNAQIVGETYTVLPSGRVTVCELTLVNGFTVRGESAVVFIENNVPATGREIARNNAVEQIWPLLGFRLRDELARASQA
jgi:hypothetical protein